MWLFAHQYIYRHISDKTRWRRATLSLAIDRIYPACALWRKISRYLRDTHGSKIKNELPSLCLSWLQASQRRGRHYSSNSVVEGVVLFTVALVSICVLFITITMGGVIKIGKTWKPSSAKLFFNPHYIALSNSMAAFLNVMGAVF
jgi:hypothetical protein